MATSPDFETYKRDLIRSYRADISARSVELQFETHIKAALVTLQASEIYIGITNFLRDLDNEYMAPRSGLLYIQSETELSDLKTKSFDSAIHKLYRKDVLFKKPQTDSPKKELSSFRDLYTYVEDLLRQRIVCKYMDGPQFICERLNQYCNDQKIRSRYKSLSNDEGYYGWHFYFRFPFEVNIETEFEIIDISVELQFQTQLSEAITHLTHGLYEEKRERGFDNDKKWKWDPKSQQFRSAYLGHGLHLLEGLIQGFRDDVLKQDTAACIKAENSDKGDN